MPASLFGDMDHGGLSLHHQFPPTSASTSSSTNGTSSLIDEDQRALQLALELSMLGLSDGNSLGSLHQLAASIGNNSLMMEHHHHHLLQNNANPTGYPGASDLYDLMPKKSQNMTECVPVPSSEHVAEIVGRQGCKIKALRAKTNTYIKTPVRGEEPVFVVTGRKEDVAAAKREILSAAEHFSQIRASRKSGAGAGPAAPAPVPGQVTIQVRVPYRVVGLVVGPKGATIKRIQQQTHTYIVTPSREKDPVFEVTGLPENVQIARREIEAHIAIRTGSFPMDQSFDNDLTNTADILANLYKNGIGSFGLDGLGLMSQLGAINSLSSSLSSVNGNAGLGGIGGPAMAQHGNGNSIGSCSSGGGSLSSLSSLNGGGFAGKLNHIGQQPTAPDSAFFPHQALSDLSFSLMDNTSCSNQNPNHAPNNNPQNNGFMSSSRSEDSYLFGGSSGPNSIEDGSQPQNHKHNDVFGTNNSVGSSLWGSFDRDEGLGDSPTLETAPIPSSNNLISLQ